MSDRSKDRSDGGKSVPIYEREAQALREKTERLRALRLARDGVEPAAPAKSAPARTGKPASTRGKSGKSSATLSEWLKTQQDQGRRS
ncbi:hypothetical protein RHODGE_RHODGE_03404 [Rhodoplanes serenus]|uniref:Uncharacterized protein n=1 Tax=Rhodoplanes serenus TaxID=200615 RepID=A0A447CYB7_9BRAD|nr:hypothetical protein [Rhodoplanes serenus]VCU10218.1 hypothetical protein RHODGE_RHODGE_03404 [Rhodoplanes serenus]